MTKKKYIKRGGRIWVIKDHGLTIDAYCGYERVVGMTRKEFDLWKDYERYKSETLRRYH